MATVVDAYNFLKDYGSTDSIQSRGESLGKEDKRSVVDLLIDQTEFCDVLILNKIDLISDIARGKLMAIFSVSQSSGKNYCFTVRTGSS